MGIEANQKITSCVSTGCPELKMPECRMNLLRSSESESGTPLFRKALTSSGFPGSRTSPVACCNQEQKRASGGLGGACWARGGGEPERRAWASKKMVDNPPGPR
eukprot:scaffold47463_cov18-Tisochrysis_lutea.AAC.2